MRRYLWMAALVCGLAVATPGWSQPGGSQPWHTETPLLGGIIKIPEPIKSLVMPSSTPQLPTLPPSSSWSAATQYPNFQPVPLKRYNPYEAHYVPTNNRYERHKRLFGER